MIKKLFKSRLYGVVLAALVCVSVTGCGSSDKSYNASSDAAAAESAAYDYADVYEEDCVEEEASATSGNAEEVKNQSERKLIRNVDMNVETEQFDELIANLTAKTKTLGGYIENSCVWSNDYGSYPDADQSTREASYTIRIPKEKMDSFISLVEDGTNVTRKEESVEDVTLTYVDLDSHKKALETEQDRLLELLQQAENMDTILAIEERLTQVRYQIQSMESQLRTYDNQVDYATLQLNIREVVHIVTVDKQSVWSEISTGFGNSLYSVGMGLRHFFIWIIVHLPYLVIWAIVIAIIVLILKKIFKKEDKKLSRKERKRQAQIDKLRQESSLSAEISKDASAESDEAASDDEADEQK